MPVIGSRNLYMEEAPTFDLQDIPPDHRSGYVALIGKPNVG